MAGFILGIWILTIAGGVYMWSFTTGAGRPESNVRATDLSPLALFAHPAIGLLGISVWVVYLYQGGQALTWVALAVLVVGALVGDLLLVRTLKRRTGGPRVEDLIPRPVMVLHGALAVVLIVLVLLMALGVDGGDDAAYELF
jgi:hypothetical protein